MLYRFHEYRLNTTEKNLWRGDTLVNLSPRVYDTLQMLVERANEIVPKDEMLETIWKGAFVEENNLSQKVSILRKTFGKDNNFIETIPRKGFRFIEPVEIVTDTGPEKLKTTKDQRIVDPEESPSQAGKIFPAVKELTSFKTYGLRVSLLGLLAIALAYFGYTYYRAADQNQNIPPSYKVELLTNRGEVRFPMISPGGESIAFVKPNSSSIFIKDIESGNDTEIKVDEGLRPGFLRISPDEKHIYFRERKRQTELSNIYRMAKFGGASKLIVKDTFAQFDISPDGGKIVFIRRSTSNKRFELTIKNLATNEESIINTKSFPLTYDWRSPPSWSPDGKMIAITHGENTVDFANLSIIDIANKTEKLLDTDGLLMTSQTLWMGKNSELLLIAEGEERGGIQIYRIAYPGGSRRKLTNDIARYKNLSISKDGKRISARTHGIYSNIWLYPEGDSKRKKQLTNQNGIEGLFGITWTPNNKIVHFLRKKNESQIQILDPTDKSSRVLASNTLGVTQFPSVAPDNKSVFYQSTEKGIVKIKSVNIENGKLRILNPDSGNPENYPVVSPDDSWVYFIERGKNGTAIRRQSLETEEEEIVFSGAELSMNSFLSISPDGRFLAFNTVESDDTADTKTGLIDLKDSFKVRYLDVPFSRPYIQWTNGGKTFDYFNDTGKGSKLWRQSLDQNSIPELITETIGEKIYYFSWSADGQNLALALGNNRSDAVLFELE